MKSKLVLARWRTVDGSWKVVRGVKWSGGWVNRDLGVGGFYLAIVDGEIIWCVTGGCGGFYVRLAMVFGNEEPFAATRFSVEEKYESAVRARADIDTDVLCPICFQMMEDAFLTRCGHNFCYTCIMTHLKNRNNCPSCARYLTTDQLLPNFLLAKVIPCPM